MTNNKVTTDVTSTSATYAPPTTGTASSVAVTTTGANQKILITLNTRCYNSGQDNGCYMSFASTGSGGGGLTRAANDNFSIGNGRPGDTATNQTWNGGATYLVTVPTPGTTTFTAQFRRGLGGTATFQMNELIAQVLSP